MCAMPKHKQLAYYSFKVLKILAIKNIVRKADIINMLTHN